jgi:hypothetical protein
VQSTGTLYPQITYGYDTTARGTVPEDQMTGDALFAFAMQQLTPDPNAKVDYDVIVNQANRQFGCAWSGEGKCGGARYLYCSFYHG